MMFFSGGVASPRLTDPEQGLGRMILPFPPNPAIRQLALKLFCLQNADSASYFFAS
jgi:hypothetical protein